MIIKWFKQRRKLAMKRRYNCGYAFAAAELLRKGADAIEEMQDHIACSKHFGQFDEFDTGIEDAIIKFEQQQRIGR